MTITLEGAAYEPEENSEPYTPHNIVYGALGWTDEFDDAHVDLLTRIGAIWLAETISGLGWETRIYISTQGKQPHV